MGHSKENNLFIVIRYSYGITYWTRSFVKGFFISTGFLALVGCSDELTYQVRKNVSRNNSDLEDEMITQMKLLD